MSRESLNLPAASAVIHRLPVVIRDRMDHVSMPVQYEEACKALIACITIDETKYWANKADALAAWAKIYKSDAAAIAARRLKLQAYRRMGEIAEELASAQQKEVTARAKLEAAERVKQMRAEAEAWKAKKAAEDDKAKRAQIAAEVDKLRRKAKDIERSKRPLTGKGHLKGANAILQAHGVDAGAAIKVLNVSRMPKEKFRALETKGATIARASYQGRGYGHIPKRTSPMWDWLVSSPGSNLHHLRSTFKQRKPRDVAAGIAPGEVKQARELAIELSEWLDEFEQALSKGKGK